jgi:hypothetical protein
VKEAPPLFGLMADCHIDAKFGTPPAHVPLPNAKERNMFLFGQFIVCSLILCVLSPSFVMCERRNGTESLDVKRVWFVSFSTVLASVILDLSDANPKDSFMKAFEILYRSVKA